MSTSELFDMDCSSPVASTSARPVAQRFLVDYAPPTHIKPIAVDQHPSPRRLKSPQQTVEANSTVSYISGDDSERIRRWLLATHQAQAQAEGEREQAKAKSAFSDSEDEDEEDEDEYSESDSESSCSESDSDRIFLQPRRHQQSSSSLPPHPRQGQATSSPAAAHGNGKSKSASPLPVFPRRRTAPGSVTAMMMSHLTAARPALPVVCLSEANGQVDISPSSSTPSHSLSPSHSRSGSRDQPCRSRWSSSCSIQQPRSNPSWYEDDEADSLNVPALVEDDECAPASTSTRSIPIPIATSTSARFPVPRRARARGRTTQRNPIEFGNAETGAKFGLQSVFDDDSSEEEEEEEYESDIVVEEEWDEDYQSPPHRRALNAAKGHMDGQSFYNGWLSQYHNQALVAEDRA